jgi:hypothetical protein
MNKLVISEQDRDEFSAVTPAKLTPEKKLLVPLNRRSVGPYINSLFCKKNKKPLVLGRNQNLFAHLASQMQYRLS